MKILITSGGTREAIDQVRSITNHSTGRLGKEIAETFLKAGHQVSLVTTKSAIKPNIHPNLTIMEVSNVDSLQQTLEPLVKNHDVLIHSMAVSDYTPVYMAGIKEVADVENIYDFLEKKNTENKISSTDDYQVLFLKKTPKLISSIKKWNPNIQLIGFKLLVGVSKEELWAVARDSLKKNQADYILANDLMDIKVGQHRAYLIGKDTEIQLETKSQIAQMILELVSQRKEF
ncbi:phosphopantothenate--cysteine ligase [Streptococcus minor]|uniref:Phosphopantothenate--cysteine ligase n=1 Tax=Streptococcus minor TaxID=229549 RepID=A0A3P1VFE6_9STRE|nr:phosphopantothenate--cysteine ligase [Streptococcus minor]RRD32417.1 phosphopantothenate--cysteine ligase [Streptococcus minor]